MNGLKTLLTHRITVRVCQIVMGLIFTWAGLAKLGDLATFSLEVHNFRMVPVPLENLLAMTLPWIEVVAGLALVLGIRSRPAAMLVAFLMAVFIVAVGQAVARNLDIECGCFGTADATQVGFWKLAENSGMLLVSVIASLRAR